MAGIPNEVLFNDSRYAKLREQWCAAIVGIGYRRRIGYCEVAINDTAERQDADFFMEVNGLVFAFQVVEAQDPDRKRGKEHKDLASGRIKLVHYHPEKGSREGVRWVCDQIAKKSAKRYSGSKLLSLLVYANFKAEDLKHDRLVEAAAAYKDDFLSIWVITSQHVCSLYSHPRLGSIPGWLGVRELG